MRLIKTFLRRNHEIQRFTTASKQLMERMVSVLRFTETTMPLILLLMNGSIMLVLWFGSKEIQAGQASVGDVVAVVNYAMRMTAALSIFTMVIMNFSRAKASGQRIVEVLNAEDEEQEHFRDENNRKENSKQEKQKEKSFERTKDGRRKGRGLILEQVSFQYPDTNAPVLANISLHIQAEETVAILGATGSGKSSLFQLIPRLYEVSAGRILLDGISLTDIPASQLRREIGYVPQEAFVVLRHRKR